MRLPLKDSDYFVTRVNETIKTIDEEFFNFLKPKLQMKKVDVMLGDGTITNAQTFDLTEITNEFRRILQSLKDWAFTDISDSKTEDLYRLYFQITCNVDKFYIYGYFGIQRSEEHTSELQSRLHLVCRLLLEKKKNKNEIE